MPSPTTRKSPITSVNSGSGKQTIGGSWQDWPAFLLFIAVTALVYFPAWTGLPIWDDDAHITRASLRSFTGLVSIWTDPTATQQYYPVVHSLFWIEHQLWGESTLGYHLVTIFLHATAAFLFFRLLRRLQIPGAWLAGGIFALHPVHVESVAWISELKNTLSGVCYLGAALAYFRFDETRHKRFYALAVTLFILGLLSKTVIATLPAALLLILWWKRGKLQWKRDILPTLPLFAVGIAAGLFTAWVERKLLHAEGADFNFSFVERCLIAGRAFWFYLGKLFWPAHLMFSYPRWKINPSASWQYLFPLAAICSIASAGWIALRQRRRTLLTALLFFAGTLFPALGFFNVFPFRFSFVADHFQYLASLGIIALVGAALNLMFQRVEQWRFVGRMLCLGILLLLGVLSWQQAHIYQNIESVWLDTLKKNPASTLAHNNYGRWLDDRGKHDEAISHFQTLMTLQPDKVDGYINLGSALLNEDKVDEAMEKFQQALKLDPSFAMTHYNLAKVLERKNKRVEAKAEYLEALRLEPAYAEAHYNLGLAYMNEGSADEAARHLAKAIQLKPDYGEPYGNLGLILHRAGRTDEAIALYAKALQLNPANLEAHLDLGVALVEKGEWAKAREQYLQAMQINPSDANVRNNLADLAIHEKRYEEALAYSNDALRLKPDLAAAHYNAGNALFLLNRFDEAITHYRQALEIDPHYQQAQNNLQAALRGKLQAENSTRSR